MLASFPGSSYGKSEAPVCELESWIYGDVRVGRLRAGVHGRPEVIDFCCGVPPCV